MFRSISLRAAWRAILGLLGLGLLSACSYPDLSPSFPEDAKSLRAETFDCCFEPEKFYPAPLIRAIIPLATALGPTVAGSVYGDFYETEFPGTLTGKPEPVEAVVSRMQPLDFMVVGSTSYKMGRMVPGRFTHGLVYVGTEAELRAAGLWSIPEIVPYHDDIRAGMTFLQAAAPAVHLTTPKKAFERDRVLAIRPQLSYAERRLAIKRLFASMGVPFNYTMGVDPTHQTFSCTGLLKYAMPSLGLRTRQAYGQQAMYPDDLAAQAIRGENMKIITYVLGNDGPGFSYRSTYALMVDIAAYWGVPDTP